MPQAPDTVGSAAALTLAKLDGLKSREDFSRFETPILIGVARFCGEQAAAISERDPAKARDFLLHGASRLIAAAERLGFAADPCEVAACSR